MAGAAASSGNDHDQIRRTGGCAHPIRVPDQVVGVPGVGITGDEREDVPATVRDHPRAFATGPTPTAAAAGVPTPRTTRPLTFTGPMGLPLDRNRFNDRVWRPALRATGVETAGESIKALSEYRT